MPRRPDNARVEILIPLTSTLLRPGTGVYNHSRDLHTGMTWAECRQLPMTNTDWWWLLQRRAIRFVLPDGSELQRAVQIRQPREPRTSTSVRALRSVIDESFPIEFTFGIEIECVLPRTMSHRSLAQALNEAGIAAHVEGYNHHTSHDWKITTDGSIRCHGGRYTYGTELVSPILRGIDGMNQAIKVCKILVENRVKVNKSCGLHVHVGARNRPVEWFRSVLQIYSSHEASIDSMLAPSRRGSSNGYCNTIRLNQMVQDATTLDELRAAYNYNMNHLYYRFRKVNLEAFWRHGTIEFRQHQGTIKPDKVEHWVRFVLAICERARQTYERSVIDTSLESLMSLIGMSERSRHYHIGRRDYFARREAAQTTRQAA